MTLSNNETFITLSWDLQHHKEIHFATNDSKIILYVVIWRSVLSLEGTEQSKKKKKKAQGSLYIIDSLSLSVKLSHHAISRSAFAHIRINKCINIFLCISCIIHWLCLTPFSCTCQCIEKIGIKFLYHLHGFISHGYQNAIVMWTNSSYTGIRA